MRKYKAIIFDLGKVIFDLSFDRTFKYWAIISGLQLKEIKDKFEFDETFVMFEKDEITATQFRSKISERLKLKLTDQEFDEGWCDLYLEAYNGIGNLLIDLKKSYQLVALTNTNSIHSKVWLTKYADTLQHFEKIFCSHEMKVRKPEKEAYQAVFDYLNLPPYQTIFLDDNIENINGANNLGIKTILVSSPTQMINELLILTN